LIVEARRELFLCHYCTTVVYTRWLQRLREG
jgi:hypothetical protein